MINLDDHERIVREKDARIADLEREVMRAGDAGNEHGLALRAAEVDDLSKQVAALRAALEGMLRCVCFGASPSGAKLEQANQLVAKTDAAAARLVDVDSEEMRKMMLEMYRLGHHHHAIHEDAWVDRTIAAFKARRGVK